MYVALYMAAVRTQVYLTTEQRARLAELGERDGRSLAEHVREALDAYLEGRGQDDWARAGDASFGAVPDLRVPERGAAEWTRGG
jgi:predicted DNA-binding protein